MALSHLKAIMDCYRPPNMSNGFEVDTPGFLPVGGYCATPKNLIKGIPTWYAVAMAQLEPGPTDPSYWYSCDNNSTMKTSCCTPPTTMVGFPPDGTRATYVTAGITTSTVRSEWRQREQVRGNLTVVLWTSLSGACLPAQPEFYAQSKLRMADTNKKWFQSSMCNSTLYTSQYFLRWFFASLLL